MPESGKPQLQVTRGEEIIQKRVRLDGHRFEECIFRNCLLEIGATAPFEFDECHFHTCEWGVVEYAAATIELLRLVGQMPGLEMFTQQVADHIQGKGLADMEPNVSA